MRCYAKNARNDCLGGDFGRAWRPVNEPTVFDYLYDASLDATAMA